MTRRMILTSTLPTRLRAGQVQEGKNDIKVLIHCTFSIDDDISLLA